VRLIRIVKAVDNQTDHPTAGTGRKILLLGTHGQFNIGDELLLETFLAQLGPEHRYRINSYSPAETREQLADRYDVEVFDTAADRFRLLRFLFTSDMVVFGGGSIVKELNASTGRRKCSTLFLVLGAVTFARQIARRPVLLCNIGVGPVHTKRGRRMARAILRQASLVAVRDAASEATCRELGVAPDAVRQVPDAAFVNAPDHFVSRLQRRLQPIGGWGRTPNRRLRIALNLNRDLSDSADWERFLAQLSETFRIISSTTPIEIIALPMQTGFKEYHDRQVLKEFFDSMPGVRTVIDDARNHRDIAGAIARSDVVVSERFHAIVLAAIIGRPVVALAYSSKVDELVDQLGPGTHVVDANSSIDAVALADSIMRAAHSTAHEGNRLAGVADEARRQLDHHFADVRRWVECPSIHSWADCEVTPGALLGC
jgi:polysaccharide pyruvyl transferase CsaB